MATDFTQDSVLHFLQSSGSSVKNSDLLQHFRTFIRDHADRDRNRELFKTFVNSVATVQQIDGVSYVVLRKKFRGHVPGGGEEGSSGPRRLSAGKLSESNPERVGHSPAQSAEQPRQKPQLREVTTPSQPAVTAMKTVLPAAGIMLNNNNNVERNLNLKQQQVASRPEGTGRPAAQGVSQISEKTELKTPSLAKPPAMEQCTKVGQHRVGLSPPRGITPVVPAVSHHRETSQQVPDTPRGGETHRLSEGGVHQEPDLHHIGVHSQVTARRIRHRKSYKSAVSYDEDEEEDEEEEDVPVRRGSADGAWPLNADLKDMGRAISASSPCIIDQSASPPVNFPFSSERKLPQIYIQDIEAEPLPPGGPGWSSESGAELRGRSQWAGPGMEPGSAPGEWTSTRRSLPLEAGRYVVSPVQAEEVVANHNVHTDCRYSQPVDVQWEARQGPNQSQSDWLLSSHSSILSPSSDTGLSSSDHSSSDDHRRLGLNSSFEELQARRGKPCSKIQEVLQRTQRTQLESRAPWHHSTGHLLDDQEPIAHLSPFHRSYDYLHGNQDSTASVLPWHLSTGDLCDDREEAESSDGSTSSPPLRQRPAVARRLSSHLRSRMCRSMGADLDQLLQEEARGGSEVARLNRLQLISSSLSLRYDLSSSSLSSCSTPPRCHSVADLAERVEGRGGRKSLPSASTSSRHPEGSSRQSLVPLEPREHAWLVKGAAGAWPDIYSLFREDSSLLNKKDFISGFTVLHWIAKHGDHRVLNTLWYGVEKAGLTFDIDSRSTCGHTPLHIAAMHGNKNIMQLLVNKFKANVRLRDTTGKKAWQYLTCNMPPDIFQLLGAPLRVAWGGQGVGMVDTSWKQEKQQRQQQRHYLSSASSGERPLTLSGTTKVKRSSSIAALLKHKSMRRFYGHQSDSSV